MSLFDFLTKGYSGSTNPDPMMTSQAQDPRLALASGGQDPSQGMHAIAPMEFEARPQGGGMDGFLSHFRKPNDQGLTWADKLYAIGSTLGGDGDSGMQYLQGKTKDFRAQKLLDQTQQDRARKNAAFKAAYQNGKFDPGVYASNLGQAEVNPSDIAALTRAFAPHAGVDGGYSYTQDPGTGETKWGGQRPQSYAEAAAIAREAEAERRDRELEAIAHQNADSNTFRSHRPRASAAPQSWLPPGARVVHVPGS